MNDQEQTQERPFGGFSDSSHYDGLLEDKKFYPAVLLGLKERYIDGQYPGWKVIWGFRLTLADGNTEMLEGMSSQATGPDSKAGEWLVALVGQERFNTRGAEAIKAELEDLPCSVYVQFSDKGWPRVGGVFPVEGAQNAPQAAPASTPTPPTTTAKDYDDLPF